MTLWKLINHLEYISACESGSASVLIWGGKAGFYLFLLREFFLFVLNHVGANAISSLGDQFCFGKVFHRLENFLSRLFRNAHQRLSNKVSSCVS